MRISNGPGKSWKNAAVAALFSATLIVGAYGCGEVESTPTTGPTPPSTGASSAGDSFVVGSGSDGYRQVTKTLPHTVRYKIKVPADNASFDNVRKSPILLTYGPGGVKADADFPEVRTYKIKNYDINGRYPCGEPRFSQVWAGGQTYEIEVTQTTEKIVLKIDGQQRLDVCGKMSSKRTFRVGWPLDGYKFPGLTGATITLLEGWK